MPIKPRLRLFRAQLMSIVSVTLVALLLSSCGSSGEERHAQALEYMAWCHEMDGLYSNSISWKQREDGSPRFHRRPGHCLIAPPRSFADGLAREQQPPDGELADSDWFACRIMGDGPDGQSMYAHCEGYIEVQPQAGEPR